MWVIMLTIYDRIPGGIQRKESDRVPGREALIHNLKTLACAMTHIDSLRTHGILEHLRVTPQQCVLASNKHDCSSSAGRADKKGKI